MSEINALDDFILLLIMVLCVGVPCVYLLYSIIKGEVNRVRKRRQAEKDNEKEANYLDWE